MKHFILLTLAIAFNTAGAQHSASDSTRSFFNKNTNAIEQGPSAPLQMKRAVLEPGLYYVEDESRGRGWSHFMLLDSFVNDSTKLIGFILSRDALGSEEQTRMQIIQAIPLSHGTVMLSPIVINDAGVPSVETELGTGQSKYMEVSLDETRPNGDHFNIIGHNGAQGGRILSMKRVNKSRPTFSGWPSNGLFNSETVSGNLLVRGNIVSVTAPHQSTKHFQISALNNENGRIAGLQSATMDERARRYIVDSVYTKFAFFLKDTQNNEVFVIANPTHKPADYIAHVYCPKKRSLFQIVADLINAK